MNNYLILIMAEPVGFSRLLIYLVIIDVRFDVQQLSLIRHEQP
jgi:hypothetical protein